MYKSLFGEANGIEFTINKHDINNKKLESSYQLQIKYSGPSLIRIPLVRTLANPKSKHQAQKLLLA